MTEGSRTVGERTVPLTPAEAVELLRSVLKLHNQTPTGRTRKCLPRCLGCEALVETERWLATDEQAQAETVVSVLRNLTSTEQAAVPVEAREARLREALEAIDNDSGSVMLSGRVYSLMEAAIAETADTAAWLDTHDEAEWQRRLADPALRERLATVLHEQYIECETSLETGADLNDHVEDARAILAALREQQA